MANEITMPEGLAARRAGWRREFLARRASMSEDERHAAEGRLAKSLATLLADIDGVLGFYWPIQREFDARPLVTEWLARSDNRHAVLPVVTKRHTPLLFRDWTPTSAMRPAGFGTSVPDSGEWRTPTCLLVPLVGFDAAGYRLGYGGGYYDRTLASLSPRPRTIGVGFECTRLPSIDPQSFDLRLDTVLTA